MNRTEVAALLTFAARTDRRTVGTSDTEAWFDALYDLPFDECREAVTAHYAQETVWLMPAHVRRLVTLARNERRARAQAEQIRAGEQQRRQLSAGGLTRRPAWFRDELRAGYEDAAPHWAAVWERLNEDVRKRGGEPPKRGPRLGDNYRGIGDPS